MGYHPRIETTTIATFQTTKTRGSRLWFVYNPELEESILGYLAKYSSRYEVVLYAFSFSGNHQHFPALFPKGNRASFMRDFNSSVARATARTYQFSAFDPTSQGTGGLWARRYSAEFLSDDATIEDKFFYTVLQPVQDGLVERLEEYPSYSCFHDAVSGNSSTFKVVDWKRYNYALKRSGRATIADYTTDYTLTYARLPGYEHLCQEDYKALMYKKLEEKRQKIVEERRALGLGFMGRAKLLKVKPGSLPRKSKTSTINDPRPRALASSTESKRPVLEWYFATYDAYKKASLRYRQGDMTVEFPPGTYKPPLFTVAHSGHLF